MCVGPGLARSAGLATPAALVQRCREALPAAHPGRDELQALADVGEVGRALGRAEELLPVGRFVRIVGAACERGDARVPLVALAITRLAPAVRWICTTGLDGSIERALEYRWPVFASEPDDLCARSRGVIKLCGDAALPSTWALTRAQLDERARALPRTGRLLRGHALLLLGYRADDEALLRLVLPLRGRTEDPAARSFALVPRASATAAARERLAAYGVTLVEIAGDEDLDAAEWVHALVAAYERCTKERLHAGLEDRGWFGLRDNPYPGLAAFTAGADRRYCGREADVQRACEELRARRSRWLLVHGAAGVGKTSFVAAGVAPALLAGALPGPTTWQTLRVRPGPRPLHALSNALYSASHALQCTAPRLRERMRASAGALTDALARGFAGGVVLIVDPLDEAIAAADRDEREVFAAALAHAVAHASVPFVLITATRSEHLGDLQRLPALHDRTLGRDPPVCFGLAPMTLDQYRRAICGPARRAGINVAGRFLERFIADIEALTEGPSAPPPGTILALVAAALHETCRRGPYHELTLSTYEAMGGLDNAVVAAAEAALARPLERLGEDIVRELVRCLIAVGPDGRRVRTSLGRDAALRMLRGAEVQLRAPLPDDSGPYDHDPDARALALLGNYDGSGHLLVLRPESVELVHDVLLTRWPRLHGWMTASASPPRRAAPKAAKTAKTSRTRARVSAALASIDRSDLLHHVALHVIVAVFVIMAVQRANEAWRGPASEPSRDCAEETQTCEPAGASAN